VSTAVGLWVFWLVGVGMLQLVRFRKRGRQIDRMETMLRRARADATDGTTRYRQVREDEAFHALVRDRRDQDADARALEDLGLRALGVFVMERADSTAVFVSRAFVDEAGTTCAYIAVDPQKPERAMLIVESYTDDTTYSTSRRDHGGSLSTGHSKRQVVSLPTSIADTLARHRAFAPLGGETFVRITNADELVTTNQRKHEQLARWRRAQPPDTLLESDLRNLLGKHYARFGKLFQRRLTAELPKATLHRV
jgi:hypothetical protein